MGAPEIREINEVGGGVAVRGFLHRPARECVASLVLTHGASSNANAPLLAALAGALAEHGVAVLRIDLPFRQARSKGPPSPSSAVKDQQGLRAAADLMRNSQPSEKLILGGHSYGGRQACLLAAGNADICDGLLLLSYPLHPPGNAAKLRTAHFPELGKPALFVQGSRDPFGSVEELKSALNLIPVAHLHVLIEGAGHDLRPARKHAADVVQVVVQGFFEFFHLKQV